MSGTLTRKVKVVRETTETIYYEQVSDGDLSDKITESEMKKKINSEEFLPATSDHIKQAQGDVQMEFKESIPPAGSELSKTDKLVSESVSGTNGALPFETSSTPIRPVLAPKPLYYSQTQGLTEMKVAKICNPITCDKSTEHKDGMSTSKDGQNGASGMLPRMAPIDQVDTTTVKEVIKQPPPPPPQPTYSQTHSKFYNQSPKPFCPTLNSHYSVSAPRPVTTKSLSEQPRSNSSTYKLGTTNTLNIKKREGELSVSDINGNQNAPNQLSDDANILIYNQTTKDSRNPFLEHKLQIKSEENYEAQPNSPKPQLALNVNVRSLRKDIFGDQTGLFKPFGDKISELGREKDVFEKPKSKSEVASEQGDIDSKATFTEATEKKFHLPEKKNTMIIRNQFENRFNSLNQSDNLERKHSTRTVNSSYRNSFHSLDTDVKRIFSTKDSVRRQSQGFQSINKKGVPHISREAAAKIEQDLLKVSASVGWREEPSWQNRTCPEVPGPSRSHCSEQFYSSTLSAAVGPVGTHQQSLRVQDAKSFTSNTRLTEGRWTGEEGFLSQQNFMREQNSWYVYTHPPQHPYNL